MGGIYGRIFREFAITLSVAVLISLAVSLTTTPMMAAYLVGKPKPLAERSWFGRFAEGTVDGMRRGYEWALDLALDSGPIVLVVLAATIALNFYLYSIVPKGFFPEEDTGQMIGGLQADQSSSFQITPDPAAAVRGHRSSAPIPLSDRGSPSSAAGAARPAPS